VNASFLFVFYTFIGIIKSPFSSLWTRLDRLESVGASVTRRRISQWGWKDDLRMEVRTMSGKTPLAESNDQVKDFGLLEVSNFWCCGSKPKIEQKVGWSWMSLCLRFWMPGGVLNHWPVPKGNHLGLGWPWKKAFVWELGTAIPRFSLIVPIKSAIIWGIFHFMGSPILRTTMVPPLWRGAVRRIRSGKLRAGDSQVVGGCRCCRNLQGLPEN